MSAGSQGRGGAVRRRPRAEDSNQVALYFTYGSNLHIAQMADRCPESRFIGKGTLTGYRWQINSRGVANVVETGSHHDKVKGLVFEVTRADVRILDRYEGVRSGAYSRETLNVYVTPNDAHARKRSTDLAARLETYYQGAPRRSGLAGNDTIERVKLPALVYVSLEHNQDGTIRDEYIARMANAMADAKVLGVDSKYIREVMAPLCQPPSEQPGASQPPPTEVFLDVLGLHVPGNSDAPPKGPLLSRGPLLVTGSVPAAAAGDSSNAALELISSRLNRAPDEFPPNKRELESNESAAEKKWPCQSAPVEDSRTGKARAAAKTTDRPTLPRLNGRQPKRRRRRLARAAMVTHRRQLRTDPAVAPKRAAAKNENGTGPRATTNGEGGTTTPANASGAPAKRPAVKADNGTTPRATTNGDGASATATTNGSATAPKKKAAITKTGTDDATATATTNGSATAPKKKAATTKTGTDDATATATTATATTATATTATATTSTATAATNGTATATKTKASTKNETGAGDKPAATGAAATTKTKATKTETTPAQS
ncbi:hypothetical protein CHGG_02957 [Chaetomium globosum CBS 148.51]|uniref:gamma-glutamylcyclotransferase n=1 Tax=Chaetomium globosum (strain ATCC 6205 / CBS 148.51 / DSM 1962 / NBRC 6347 / NRRL 1970) TaxID=306901 RepID=Q2H9Z7_CHAGB|nr:uncharacterized protein CHGG_02957 [Chaetomium globosum CBS 148.51]EAQ91022.1 hypothetical protein CHGG_02957 [Chaetomium globosum CBS 148.51]